MGHDSFYSQQIPIDRAFVNIKNGGTSEFYTLKITEDLEYIDSLTITLRSITGDADLFTSNDTSQMFPNAAAFQF